MARGKRSDTTVKLVGICQTDQVTFDVRDISSRDVLITWHVTMWLTTHH
jgi:hypothetical protein